MADYSLMPSVQSNQGIGLKSSLMPSVQSNQGIMADYSLMPSVQSNQGIGLNSSLMSFGQMPQVQAPPMLDYSFGQTGAMPVAGMGGGQGLRMGGGQGLRMGGGQGLRMGGAMPVTGMNNDQDLQMGGASEYDSMSSWGAGAGAGSSLGSGFEMNIPTLTLGLQGLNSLGSLYMGSKSLSLANKQFESAQKFANINLANQTKNYNDTLENKIKRIGSFNGTSAADTAAEYERRKLTGQA